MFLISDKLDKSDPKYDLMKEDKADLLKEEKGDPMKEDVTIQLYATERHCKWSIIIPVLFGTIFCLALWMAKPPFLDFPASSHHHINDVEDHVVASTMRAINDTQRILSKVRERTANLSEENRKSAAQYVASIRDILKERANHSVTKLNEMILEKVKDIENELFSFDYVIDEAANGIVDVFIKDINDICDNIMQKIESGDAAESLDQLISAVEKETLEMLSDIDQMYTFYSHYLADILENKARNATDRISITLNAERRSCDCTIMNRINMCYNITSQNGLITDQLESTMRVIGALANTRNSVSLLESFFENGNEHSRQIFDDARALLKRTEETDQNFLDSLLEDESNFLGSLVTKKSFQDSVHIKRYVLRSFKTTIDNLPKFVNDTVKNFEIVKPKHLNDILINVELSLRKMGDAIKDKAHLVNSSTGRDEYVKKADFAGLKLWMNDRFANVTSVINPIFERRKEILKDMLDCNTEFIIENQLSYMSMLSVANYLPSDICPLSTDYQKYVSLTVEEAANDDGLAAIDDMMETATYFTTEFSAETNVAPNGGNVDVELTIQNGSGNENGTGGDGEVANIQDLSQIIPPYVMNVLQGIIQKFTDAGYELDGPIEVIVEDDETT